ncbi:unnamed protein product [Fusarium graminearum]|nr:unnamed protein product [Fusarium graminearum]CAG1971980.1 unnamed protein product [Fusarium graminearum]VTO94222.1 unnamed protein product [Fusarium graminearum]
MSYKSRARADACEQEQRCNTRVGKGKDTRRKTNYAQNFDAGQWEGRADRTSPVLKRSVSGSNQRGRSSADSGRDCDRTGGSAKGLPGTEREGRTGLHEEFEWQASRSPMPNPVAAPVNLQIPMSRMVQRYQIASGTNGEG